ncbi:MAG: aminoglycoside N(3)-acetyltransferase [Spirochaetes bacterium]|nr:MAG: aminoglycoside N(3)-acetyltransferase [Spirochaetota bacterium]
MSKRDVIRRTKFPNTVDSLKGDLESLGLEPGMTVLVHSSLSSLGWTCGGAMAVITALKEVLRNYGTLVMPTHTTHLTDPSEWKAPPVPEKWWDTIRKNMPPFEPESTPSMGMGIIPECFRTLPDVLRSKHPHYSFAAWGENAVNVLDNHSLEYGLGDGSPLARIYDLEGWILLLGTAHANNTSFHLSEYRAEYRSKREVIRHAPVLLNGHRRWKSFPDINIDSSDFSRIGRDFLKHNRSSVKRGRIGIAGCELFPLRLCVDYGVKWISGRRR